MKSLGKKSFLVLNIICSLGLSALDSSTPTMPVHETTETTKTEKMVGTITSNLIAVGAITLATIFLKSFLRPSQKHLTDMGKFAIAPNIAGFLLIVARFAMAEGSKRYINKAGFQSNALALYIATQAVA